MSDRYFVDTNVFVYYYDAAFPKKQRHAREWLSMLWRLQSGRVSAQVLNELYHTVTQKLKPGLSPAIARNSIRNLFAWQPYPVSAELIEKAFSVQDRFGFSFWDTLIVAAAQATGSRYLLTEDLQDGQTLGKLVVVNPFLHNPPGQ
jgi:predicted nucleic acid-binding protein